MGDREMGVRELVSALAAIVEIGGPRRKTTGLVQINKCLEKKYILGGPPPTPEELDVVARRVCDQVRLGKWNQVKSKDWRKIPWCLWLKPYMLAHDIGGVGSISEVVAVEGALGSQ